MKLPWKVLFLSALSYYLICRVRLHLSLPCVKRIVLFNLAILLTFVVHTCSGTRATVTHDDDEETDNNRLEEELWAPVQSNAIVIHEGAASQNNDSGKGELVVDKSIILVEKYAKEEQVVEEEEEEIIMDIAYNDFEMEVKNEYDTGWQLVVVESLAPEVKEVVCVENELDKLDLDAINRKFDEFIGMQKRKWQLDSAKHLQLVKV